MTQASAIDGMQKRAHRRPRAGTEQPRPLTVVHLGAGQCAELDGYLNAKARRIVLVEANPDQARRLGRRVAGFSGVEVIPAAVAAIGGRAVLKLFNLAACNSLRSPSGLQRLFPGLRFVQELEVDAMTPVELIERIGLSAEEGNWLAIDTPGEEMAILQALRQHGSLARFEKIILRCGKAALYEGADDASTLLSLLREEGYEITDCDEEPDPELPRLTLQVNPLRVENLELRGQLQVCEQQIHEQIRIAAEREQQLARLMEAREAQARLVADRQAQIEELTRVQGEQTRRLAEIQARLERVSRERDERDVRLAELQLGSEQASRALELQERLAADLRLEIDRLVRVLDEQPNRTAELQGRLQQGAAGQERLLAQAVELQDRMERLAGEQQARLERIEQSFKKELARGFKNSIRQFESRLGIEAYLDRGRMTPATHGWAVSADLAFYLLGLIEKNDYDLILEFGSGTSTLLMAAALLQRMQGSALRKSHAIDGAAPRVVAFEHHRKYFEDTKEKLHQTGVSRLVDLNYAPLRDYVTPEGEHFLYYSCEERIAELKLRLEGERARILLFVDGPPGKDGRWARYPALPIVLQHLAAHRLDVVLDDCNREDEREIVRRWEGLLVTRALAYEKVELEVAKGACLLSIK